MFGTQSKHGLIPSLQVQNQTGDVNHLMGFLQLIEYASRLLRFHQSTGSPPELQPQHSLLFCPGPDTLQKKLLQSKFPQLKPSLMTEQGNFLSLEGHSDWVRSCAYSPDGRLLASCSDDKTVCIWDPRTGEIQRKLDGFDSWVYRVLFSAKNNLLATMQHRSLKIWDGATFVLQVSKEGLGQGVAIDAIHDMDFSPDGSKLAAAMDDIVAIWDIPSYELVKTWTCPDRVNRLRFSGNASLAISSKSPNRISIRSLEDGQVLRNPRIVGFEIDSLCSSPDSRLLAGGSHEGAVLVWEADSDAPTFRTFSGHTSPVMSVSFSPDSSRLASASSDKTIRIWNLKGGVEAQQQWVLPGHLSGVTSVSFSPVEHSLASGSMDNTVRVWDVGDATTAKEPGLRHNRPVSIVKFAPNGQLVASASEDGLVCIWDGNTGRHRRCLQGGHEGAPLCLFFSTNGRRLGLTSTDGSVIVWNTKSTKRTHDFHGHEDWVRSGVFSIQEQLVASASDDGTVRVWDLNAKSRGDDKGGQLQTLKGHTDCVKCVAFSPDGKRLLSGGDDSSIRLWDLKAKNEDGSGASIKSFNAPSQVTAVAFSLDGRRIVSSSSSGSLIVWDVERGERLQTTETAPFSFSSLQFSQDFPDWVLTEDGAWPIGTGSAHSSPVPCRLSFDQSWIQWEKKDLIFLPKGYRPFEGARCVLRNKVVIGCESGLVLLFRFHQESDI